MIYAIQIMRTCLFTAAAPNLSAIILLVGGFVFSAAAQEKLPDKIQGYKVYGEKISVKNQTAGAPHGETGIVVNVGEPEIADISAAGVTLAVSAEISNLPVGGDVDFLTFHGFRVNGLEVTAADYRTPFKITKNGRLKLPAPIKIFLSTLQTLRGARGEISDSKAEWRVTGRIFVFGKFKKSFLKFKRVVPVEVDLKIKNPLSNEKIIR